MIGSTPGPGDAGRPHTNRVPRRLLARLPLLAVLTASSLFFVAPLYWVFTAAFKPPGTVDYPPSLVPTAFSLENFLAVATETPFVDTYLVNSVLVSAGTVLATVVVGTLAGYALSRYSIPHERAVLVSLLVVQMVPILAMIVPLYRLFGVLGILDTLTVVALADTMLAVPIATWLIKGYYDTLPPGLEDAARVGGASRFAAFRVIAPLGRPAIGASALYAFVLSWNQFLVPLTFTSRPAVWTFPVGLYGFISRRGVVEWELLGAASLVAMLPVLVLFLLFQRQFLTGLPGSRASGGARGSGNGRPTGRSGRGGREPGGGRP